MKKIITPEGLTIEVDYNHGYDLIIWRGKEMIRREQICEHKGTDYREIFSFRNIYKYYKWSLLQRIFWKNVHKPIGNWLKVNTDLSDTPKWQ